jgi:SAM-dependent methyltransferase
MKKISEEQRIKNLLREKANVILDLGCGENKCPGTIGVDFRKMKGVDIVCDLAKYPWKELPDKCADVIRTSHLLEHINPAPANPQLAGLIKLLLEKGLVKKSDIDAFVGDYEFLGGLISFMDEAWRVLKPGGQAQHVFPYAGSNGYWMDPTHLNPMTHVTMAYFDPLAKDSSGHLYNLYTIYRPKPWKLLRCYYDTVGFTEICMERREIDPSYHVVENNGINK